MLVSVKGIVEHRGRYLLMRNHRDEFELPGGHPEMGETAEATVAREIREETGLQISSCDYVGGESFEVAPETWVFILAFACKVANATVSVSHEHRDHRWCRIEDLAPLPLPPVYERMIRRSLGQLDRQIDR